MGLVGYNPLTVTKAQCEEAWHAAPQVEDFQVGARAVCAAIHSLLDYEFNLGRTQPWAIEPENAILYVGRSYRSPDVALYSRWASTSVKDSLRNFYYYVPHEDLPYAVGDRSAVAVAVFRCEAALAKARMWEKAIQRFLSMRLGDGRLCVSGLDWDIEREGIGGEPEPRKIFDRTAIIYIGLRKRPGRPANVVRAYTGRAVESAGRKLHETLAAEGCRALGSIKQAIDVQRYAQKRAQDLPARYRVDRVVGMGGSPVS